MLKWLWDFGQTFQFSIYIYTCLVDCCHFLICRSILDFGYFCLLYLYIPKLVLHGCCIFCYSCYRQLYILILWIILWYFTHLFFYKWTFNDKLLTHLYFLSYRTSPFICRFFFLKVCERSMFVLFIFTSFERELH